MTGLPFVFAAWVSNKKLDENFLVEFNKAVGVGLNELENIVAKLAYKNFNLMEYYTKNIKFMPAGDIEEIVGVFLGRAGFM